MVSVRANTPMGRNFNRKFGRQFGRNFRRNFSRSFDRILAEISPGKRWVYWLSEKCLSFPIVRRHCKFCLLLPFPSEKRERLDLPTLFFWYFAGFWGSLMADRTKNQNLHETGRHLRFWGILYCKLHRISRRIQPWRSDLAKPSYLTSPFFAIFRKKKKNCSPALARGDFVTKRGWGNRWGCRRGNRELGAGSRGNPPGLPHFACRFRLEE